MVSSKDPHILLWPRLLEMDQILKNRKILSDQMITLALFWENLNFLLKLHKGLLQRISLFKSRTLLHYLSNNLNAHQLFLESTFCLQPLLHYMVKQGMRICCLELLKADIINWGKVSKQWFLKKVPFAIIPLTVIKRLLRKPFWCSRTKLTILLKLMILLLVDSNRRKSHKQNLISETKQIRINRDLYLLFLNLTHKIQWGLVFKFQRRKKYKLIIKLISTNLLNRSTTTLPRTALTMPPQLHRVKVRSL